jgi:hypothetical protein
VSPLPSGLPIEVRCVINPRIRGAHVPQPSCVGRIVAWSRMMATDAVHQRAKRTVVVAVSLGDAGVTVGVDEAADSVEGAPPIRRGHPRSELAPVAHAKLRKDDLNPRSCCPLSQADPRSNGWSGESLSSQLCYLVVYAVEVVNLHETTVTIPQDCRPPDGDLIHGCHFGAEPTSSTPAECGEPSGSLQNLAAPSEGSV